MKQSELKEKLKKLMSASAQSQWDLIKNNVESIDEMGRLADEILEAFKFWTRVEDGLPVVPEDEKQLPVFVKHAGFHETFTTAGYFLPDDEEFIDNDGNIIERDFVIAYAEIPPLEKS